MLIRIDAKDAQGFNSELGEYNVITKKLRLWFSPIYVGNESPTIKIKDFEMPKDCSKVEIVDQAGYEVLAVPLNTFKEAFNSELKCYEFNYQDWKKKYLKRF